MKTIIRNFISVLRRFKMATLLNILGLSVAFAAFIIIMMQVDFDRNFDRFHTNYDRIFRLERTYPGGAGAINSRPFSEAFFQSSPHIVAGAISRSWGNDYFFSVESGGSEHNYRESRYFVSPSYTEVFDFAMHEGDDNTLEILAMP